MALLWKNISYNGVNLSEGLSHNNQKKLIFFNQVLFIGFFATLLQIVSNWKLIGAESLQFLFVCGIILVSFILNKKGKFHLSKRIFIYSIYLFGTYSMLLLGGNGLYHLGVLAHFIFALILFDIHKEKFEILVGIPFIIVDFLIGELGILNAPDFSSHPGIEMMRFSNLFSAVTIVAILTVFILRLNSKTEEELNKHKSNLESLVHERTSEIKRQKDILEKQNNEKEILLKEIHHRVKNNLQIIVSLINLQISKLKDDASAIPMLETQSRVFSMALAHTKMYQTKDLKEISVNEYCNQLVENFQNLYPQKQFKYKIDILDRIKLNMEQTVLFGLILNEVLSNFVKHVLTDNDKSFSIRVTHSDDGKIEFIYSDNGNGFGKEVDLKNPESLGLQLIESLTQQLEGTLTIKNDPGANISYSFQMI